MKDNTVAKCLLFRPPLMIHAAREGRVADLFFSDSAESPGAAEDLLNTAALQALLHGGRAFVMDEKEMPVAGDVAAVMRY